ncbi:hypothetical protein J6W91_02690 [Candidatus Saccharibacteria bacterium]|nr:hypothetical protein [Candidatus Saccharibacteria bacterium]
MTAQWTMLSYTKTYSYTGAAQTLEIPYSGYYKVELWGASGGWDHYTHILGNPAITGTARTGVNWDKMFGYGGYTAGDINLAKTDSVYVYVGELGKQGVGACNTNSGAAWNGGGIGMPARDCPNSGGGGGGGGATDIRLTNGAWNNATSLRSRIMVAGAGGGGPTLDANVVGSGSGGGLSGVGDVLHGWGMVQSSYGCGTMTNKSSGTQTTGGGFGQGQNGIQNNANGTAGGAGGGSGYWGGYNTAVSTTTVACQDSGAGGGSSYISGHTGAVAIQSASTNAAKTGCTQGTTDNSCSIHYSGKKFINTVMIDGEGKAWTNTRGSYQAMPNPTGGNYAQGAGHTGAGYARVTWLGDTI